MLSDNLNMLRLCRAFGFTVKRDPGQAGISLVRLELDGDAA